MYSIFEELCRLKNVTPYKIWKETGISRSTLSDWKNGKSMPKADKLQKIADYFGVSLEYLMTGREKKFSDESAHLVAKIRNDTRLSEALSKYFELPDAKKKHVIELINFLSEV